MLFENPPDLKIGLLSSNFMAYWLLFLLLQPGLSIKILTFDLSSGGGISYDVIDQSTPLPQIFTLCLAFKENLIYTFNNFFTIYGDAGESWLTLGNFADGHIGLWLKINKDWVKLAVIPEHLMSSWIHVCIMTDTLSGNISVLVNEDLPLYFTVPGLTQHTPEDLKGKLYIGQSEDQLEQPKQFQGEVANFNIFTGFREVKNLMEKSCEHAGDIVNKDTEWRRMGVVKERNEESWMICNNNDIYRMAIPEQNNWDSSRDLCEKLGGGHLTEPKSEKDMADVESALEKMNSSCIFVYTSVSDEEVEGEFRSNVTGQLMAFQPWVEGQPNGKEEQNHVVFDVKSKLWYDMHRSVQYCSACDVNKSLTFTLLGGCGDASFGKNRISCKLCMAFAVNHFSTPWEI